VQEDKREPWTYRFLIWTTELAFRYPWKVIFLAFLLCLGSIVYSARNLTFQTDRAALVDENEHFAALARNFQKEFPENEDLIVVIDGGSADKRENFCDELAARLRLYPKLYKDVFTRVELPFLRHQALIYLDESDLKNLLNSLREAQGMVTALSTQQGVGDLLAQTTRDLEKMLPVLNEILGQLLKSLQTRGRYQYESPWEKAFFSDGHAKKPEDNRAELLKEAGRTAFYNTLADGRIHVLLARPDREQVSESIAKLRQEVRRLKPAYPELGIGITGELVLDEDEMQSSTNDSTRATLWSLVIVVILFLASFQRLSRPVMAIITMLIAVGWTIGFTTLAIGHLNLLTVTFATMLIGVGIDFGIHIIYGYEEERAVGVEPRPAMLETMRHAGVENLTGAVTTAVAFWAICFTDFRGVAELGAIAGTGVLLCFIAMITVLPAMMFLQEQRRPDHSVAKFQPGWAWVLARLENLTLTYPRIVLLLCLIVSAWCFSNMGKVKFDYNLLNLQSKTLQSVQTEMKLLNADQGVLFAISLADNLEHAEELSDKFAELSTVSKVDSVVPLIPKHYGAKAPILDEISAVMASVPLPNPQDAAQSGTSSGLMKMGNGFMALESAFREAYPRLIASPDPEVRQNAKRFKSLLDTLFATLAKMGPGPISDSVTSFQTNLYGDLRQLLQFLKDQRADKPITLDDLPFPIRLRSVGQGGKILVRVYPKENPWDRQSLDIFLKQVQKVDPNVIGTPVMIYYHTEALKRAFEVSGWYAFGAICVILIFHFRNLTHTLLALLPKVVGVLWMLGAMAYFEVDFNPANFMALPLILGIGLIFGVHVVHRLLHDPGHGVFAHSTGPAIALDAATTIAGFGTLMMARHQGIASLGFLMTVGIGANLITSLILLPAMMKIIYKAPAQ
jgi:uncharacterized protein